MGFTKGEWTVPFRTRRDGDNRCWVMRGKASICRCFGKPKTAEANAHLIAAAPDLLAACQGTFDCEYDLPKALLEKIEAAIEKAKA